MLFTWSRKGLSHRMEQKKAREYQTVRLFATLAILTLLIVFLFKVVLFGPSNAEKTRLPAQQIESAIIAPEITK
ncbi:MAG: hypothetical protein H7235_04855 [Bdellovibrionaceae bacterium]|nr:hypothetical protein [Pseudobdellovibrionaceae bacterium]